MTKKDYILLANVIVNRFNKIDKWQAGIEKIATLTEIITITEDLINVLKKENKRFDRIKFIEYINKKRDTNSLLLSSL